MRWSCSSRSSFSSRAACTRRIAASPRLTMASRVKDPFTLAPRANLVHRGPDRRERLGVDSARERGGPVSLEANPHPPGLIHHLGVHVVSVTRMHDGQQLAVLVR